MAQRQMRSDDTDKWIWGFGSGKNGNYVSAGNATDAPIDSSCSGTVGSNMLAATNASFVANQLILVHQSRGTGAGAWELNKILGYSAGLIITLHPLCNTYTDSGESQAQVIVMREYNNFTQDTSHTLTTKTWNGDIGGIFPIFVKGTATITGSISAIGQDSSGATAGTTGAGFVGGIWDHSGEGTSGASSYANDTGGSGGGAGTDNGGGGGGNGTAGTTYTGGVGGLASGNAGLTLMTFGGGGGGGNVGGQWSAGQGGGIVLIIASSISITGSISVKSGSGTWNAAGKFGSSGAGGSVLIKTKTATLGTTLIDATANAGTPGGANGRIHLDYSVSYTGTTTPTIDVSNDATLARYSRMATIL